MQKLKFIAILLTLFFIISPIVVKAAVNPELIKAQVKQTVEARKTGDESFFIEVPEGKQLAASDQQQIEIKYSWLSGKIVIRKINNQWYLSLVV